MRKTAEKKKKKRRQLIDYVVKDLVEIELNQRKKEGDEEGFEEGSLCWLKFNIWKVEQEWKVEKAGAAQKSNNINAADENKLRERANKANKLKKLQDATKQNKHLENSKEEAGYDPKLLFDSETEASCDLEVGGRISRMP